MNLYKTTKNASVSENALNDALHSHYQQTMFHFQNHETLLKASDINTRTREGHTLKNARLHFLGFLQNYHLNAYKQKQIKLIDFEVDLKMSEALEAFKKETVLLYKIDELHPKTYTIESPHVAQLISHDAFVTSTPNTSNKLKFLSGAVVLYDAYDHVKAVFDYKELHIVHEVHKVSVKEKRRKEAEYEHYQYVSLEIQGYSISFLTQNNELLKGLLAALKHVKSSSKTLYVTFDDYAQDPYVCIKTILTTDYTTRFFIKALISNPELDTLTYQFYAIKERLFDTLNTLALNHIISLDGLNGRINTPLSVFERALTDVKENQFMKRGEYTWT